MKQVFKIMALVLFILTIILFISTMRDGNYPYDQHGYYTGPDGVLHRESEAEQKFFRFLLSLVLLIPVAFFGFRKSSIRTRST